jgi:hypothetical protein
MTATRIGTARRPSPGRRIDSELVGTPFWEVHSAGLGRAAHIALVGGDPGLLEDARARLAYLHVLWDNDSRHADVVRLHNRPGVVVDVAPETVLLVALAVEAAHVGRSVGSAPSGTAPSGTAPSGTAARASTEPLDDVLIDARHGRVGIPGAVDLDLPGLARALAADIVVADLVDAGVAGALVTVGDCSRVEGAAPARDGWLVPAAGGLYRLHRGGIATTRSGAPDAPGRSSGDAVAIGRSSGDAVAIVSEEAWRAYALARAADRMARSRPDPRTMPR